MCGFNFGNGNNNCCWIIILIILFFCCGNGCDNGNDCSCGGCNCNSMC